jgi:hypothetical protein
LFDFILIYFIFLKGTDTDYAALKAHPFFKGIDWGNIFNQKPPER